MSAGPPVEQPPGRLRPTSVAAITAWAVAGLVGGWLLHGVSVRLTGSAPLVTWAQPLALVLVAAILGATAYGTWRTVQVQHERLDPHQAVNRLVLARACALVGALLAGGYAGYAVSWIGIDSDLASQRMWRSVAAALAGVAIVATSIALERACRVRSGDERP